MECVVILVRKPLVPQPARCQSYRLVIGVNITMPSAPVIEKRWREEIFEIAEWKNESVIASARAIDNQTEIISVISDVSLELACVKVKPHLAGIRDVMPPTKPQSVCDDV
jgi:hypothetical protein